MSKKVLTEEQMLSHMFDALNDGNKMDELLANSELADSPVETAPVPESGEPADPVVAEKAAEKDEPAKEGTPPPDGEVTPPEKDWRDDLPEGVREKVLAEFDSLASSHQRLEHYYRSNEGRVSKLNDSIKKLERELESTRSGGTPQPAAPTQTQTPAEDEDSPVLQELKTADPVLYAALKAEQQATSRRVNSRVEALEKMIEQKMEQRMAPLARKYDDDFVKSETQKVLERVPEAREIVADPTWKAFLNEAPESVIELAKSKKADDFVSAIDIYTVWLARNEIGLRSSAKPAAAATPAAPDGTGSRVAADRARKLQGSTGVRQLPVQKPEELDDDTALENMFHAIRKENGYR